MTTLRDRPLVIDVSRLIWRRWTGRLPTGIDRVCLAYLARFAPRALAMMQRGERRVVLSPADSDRLFALLVADDPGAFRTRLVAVLTRAALRLRRIDLAGRLYLNIGHTGLDNPGLGPWLRRRGLRPIVLVHDLIPITHPHYCRPGESERHARRMLAVLDWADGIIANSAATLASLDRFAASHDRAAAPALVAPLGVDVPPIGQATAAPGKLWFVTVGTVEARKNHALLLDIWDQLAARLGDDCPALVLVGQRGWEADATIARLDSKDKGARRVVELGSCTDAELGFYLRGARALLMPSFVEGYGLPVAEALAVGTPVIASDLAVYREFAGDIPLYLPAADKDQWLKAVEGFLEQDGQYQRQRAALAGYSPPDWQGHFALVEPWLRAMLPQS